MLPACRSEFEESEAGDQYKLNEEIEYGIILRKSRNQEKEILLATENFSILTSEKDNIPPFSRTGKHHKKRKSRKHRALVVLPKISERFILDRNSCSKKEYFNILARPRAPYVKEEPKKKDASLNPASPRFAQLAIPKKNLVFSTWYNYFNILKPEQILSLQNYLTKEEALAPKDARDYFKRLDKKKKKERKLKLKKEREEEIVKKPQKSKVMKEINLLAKVIIKNFADKDKQSVRATHIMLTDLMKKHLEEAKCIPSGSKRNRCKDTHCITLFETLDQLSVWLESNIGFDDVVDSDEEPEDSGDSSVSTITYSDISSESEKAEDKKPPVKAQKRLTVVPAEAAEEKLLEEYGELGGGEGLLDKIISEERLEEYESEFEELEPIPEEEEEIEIMLESEMEMMSEVEAEGKGEPFVIPKELSEVMMKAEESEQEVIKPPALVIEEHSPDAVCCVTIKTWTKWLVDVSHNTHHWCQWIQDVIARVRFFAAVIKGEIKGPDGKPRILKKEEWATFTETLDRDIEAWHQYNEHVKEISEKIITEFQNKRIICCSACMKSKLIIDEQSAHQVTDQLVQALNTTSYWRGWLDTIVSEAQKLKQLSFEAPTAEEESGSSSLGFFEIIELKSPDTLTARSSDTSVFVLLEMEKEKEALRKSEAKGGKAPKKSKSKSKQGKKKK